MQSYKRLNVRGPEFFYIRLPPLTGKPEQQRFTMRSGVLISISNRQRSVISVCPLPERTDFRHNTISRDPLSVLLHHNSYYSSRTAQESRVAVGQGMRRISLGQF